MSMVEVSGGPGDRATHTRPRAASDAPPDIASIEARAQQVPDAAQAPTHQTTAVVGTETERETFIPVSRVDLYARLTAEAAWPPGEAAQARRFFQFLAAWRHLSYMERLLTLKEDYLPFSPDRDTINTHRYDERELSTFQEDLIHQIVGLLERANYRPITRRQLNEIFSEDSAYGLDLSVDLGEFEEVQIYCRGATTKQTHKRSWRKLWLGHETINVPIYQRLFLLLKLKDEETRVREIAHREDLTETKARKRFTKLRRMLPDGVSSNYVYLKMFKRIPRADLQMLFPNTRVQFKLWDKVRLGVTAGGGTVVSAVTTATKVIAAANPVSILVALVALVGVVFRQVKKFFTQRNQYMMVLAQNLYFHNLADNRGVLTLLTDRAEEEDVKEEILLYSLIAKEPLLEHDLEEARLAIEAFLEEEFGVEVRFDLYDALERLLNDGIVTRAEDGVLAAVSPRDGCDHIDKKWDAYLDTADFFALPKEAHERPMA